MQAGELQKHAVRQPVQIVPTPADREVVQAAQHRLLEDPGDADALFAVAAWDEIVGDLDNAMDLLNRLVAKEPDYPGGWWLRARVVKEMGGGRDASECERVTPVHREASLADR